MTGPTITIAPTSVRQRAPRVVRLTGFLAWVAAAVSAWNLVAWGNRWYVATQILPHGPNGTAEGWEMAYERMTLVHQTLVDGLVGLLVAVALGLVWRWASRR